MLADLPRQLDWISAADSAWRQVQCSRVDLDEFPLPAGRL
jgi:hypothetical protein